MQIAPPRWWEEPGVISRKVAGVFEGGGAKGIAYAGAVAAMVEHRCWFGAVAGASAGAITSVLIAAGLTPTELAEATAVALPKVRSSRVRGLQRLAGHAAYFDNNALRDWLAALLKAKVGVYSGEPPEDDVTFQQLYAATGIELNVVAADLTVRQQVVFSHLDTPDCQVAHAVVASCAIPLAFGSGYLSVPCGVGSDGAALEDPAARYHHLVVDGGVWANFPMFVFRDASFRRFYGRSPTPVQDQVIGFLLEEDAESQVAQQRLRERLRTATFDLSHPPRPCDQHGHRETAATPPGPATNNNTTTATVKETIATCP